MKNWKGRKRLNCQEERFAPQRVKVIGDLVLWEGPLGKTVGGAHPDLFEEVEVAAVHDTLCLLHEDSSCQISRNNMTTD